MKKLIIIAIFMLAMLIYSAAFGVNLYYHGKLHIKDDNIIIYNPYESPHDPHPDIIKLSDLKHTTQEFRKCIEDGKFSGIVSIITKGTMLHPKFIPLDTKSQCERFSKEKYDSVTSITVAGKLKIIKSTKAIEIHVKDDVPYFIEFDELKNTPAEFLQCIDGGEYKGIVEITAQILSAHKDSVALRMNRLASCTRK